MFKRKLNGMEKVFVFILIMGVVIIYGMLALRIMNPKNFIICNMILLIIAIIFAVYELILRMKGLVPEVKESENGNYIYAILAIGVLLFQSWFIR